MSLTELTIRILLLFFPGILCFYIVKVLTIQPHEQKVHEVFLLTFIYGIFTYVIYAVLSAIPSVRLGPDGLLFPHPHLAFFEALTNGKSELNFAEIFNVAVLAVLLGLLVSKAMNGYWLVDMARWMRITDKFGQPNVWSFALNSPQSRWATVRDLENSQMFQGYIRAFSDVEQTREILLTDVVVYNEVSGEKLYESEYMYLARNKEELTVQLYPPPEG